MLHCEVGEGGAASLLVSAFYYVVGSLEFRLSVKFWVSMIFIMIDSLTTGFISMFIKRITKTA